MLMVVMRALHFLEMLLKTTPANKEAAAKEVLVFLGLLVKQMPL